MPLDQRPVLARDLSSLTLPSTSPLTTPEPRPPAVSSSKFEHGTERIGADGYSRWRVGQSVRGASQWEQVGEGGVRMEVACCDADHEGTWFGAWDECTVLAERVDSFDVRIVSDGQCCKGIPRRFVRKMHSAAHAGRGLERSELKVTLPPASTAELKVEPAAQPLRPEWPSPRPTAAAPPCRVVLRQPSRGSGGGGAHAQAAAEEVEVDEVAFMGRFMALRQFLELARQYAGTKGSKSSKGVLPTWRLKLSRAALVPGVIAEFGKRKGSSWVFMPTQVTLLDRFGMTEEGDDQGGLTAEMFSIFFREVFAPDAGLFEQAGDGDAAAFLPCADAPAESLRQCGRVLLKAIVDDHPIGAGLAPFVLEWLVDAHERRVFCSVEAALAQLRRFDARLAQSWELLLQAEPVVLAVLTLTDFAPHYVGADSDAPLSAATVGAAVLAGCRARLLDCRAASLAVLRDGFSGGLDLQLQLAPFLPNELIYMSQGKASLSTAELLGCFDWPFAASAAAGFGEAELRCDTPAHLRAVLGDEERFPEALRVQLFEWCTARSALPAAGLKEKIRLRHYDVGTANLPEVHTCTSELHLPPYASAEQLRGRLLLALEHRGDGFQNE